MDPIEITEKAKNKLDDGLTLYITDDEVEDIHQYSVSWNGLCGYFSVSIQCGTADEARKLFEALQAVNGIDET